MTIKFFRLGSLATDPVVASERRLPLCFFPVWVFITNTDMNKHCPLCSLFFFEVVGLGPVYVSTISLLMPLGISLLALILQSMTQW
jgi:hypothetical protein